MMQLSSLPERLRKPLGNLLRPDEVLLYAIDATSPRGLQGKTIEPWALLTEQTLHLITLQEGRSPEIVTIDRTQLEKVSFCPNKWGVCLRFIEKNAGANKTPVTIDFLKEKRTEVNRFCEELWKNVEVEVIKPSAEDASKSAISSAIDLAKITNQPGFQDAPNEKATHTVIPATHDDPHPTTVNGWLRVLGSTLTAEPPDASKTSPSSQAHGIKESRSDQTSAPPTSPGDNQTPRSLQNLQTRLAFLGSILGPIVARLIHFVHKPSEKDV